MSENRLPDYIDHIQQAAADACSFVEGLGKDDFLADKRTQQAVNLDVVWETVHEWLPELLKQLPAVRQDADDEGMKR